MKLYRVWLELGATRPTLDVPARSKRDARAKAADLIPGAVVRYVRRLL